MPFPPCLERVRQGRLVFFLLVLALSLRASCAEAGEPGERSRAEKTAVVQEPDEDHSNFGTSTCSKLIMDIAEAGEPAGHKGLFPLVPYDFWLLGGATLTSFLAANAGIGGGGILLPLLVFVAQFTPRLAAALSNVCILGGSIANFILNAQRKHPEYPGLPVIDYDLILMMEPPTVLGALLGGFANKVLTTWITTSLMAIILTIVASQLVRKALTPSTLKAFDDRHLPFPQRGDAPPHISNFARQQHGHGVGGHSSHSMNGSLRQQPLHKGADSVTIPIQLHGPGAALSSFPHTEGWMPMEPISEASSVHYGTAYSGNTLDHEHSGGLGEEQHGEGSGGGELHGRRHIKAPEMKGGEGGVPRYKLAVEDGLGLHLKKNHGRRSTDQDKLLEQGHALAGVHDPLDRQDKGENEGAEAQQQEGFRLPWGRLSWLGGLSLWVAFSQLIANKYVECGSLAYWLAILSVIPAAMFVLLHTRTRVLKEHKRHAFLPREPSHRPRDSVVGQELSVPLLPHEDGEMWEQQQQQQWLANGKPSATSSHTAVLLPQPSAQPIKPEIDWTPKTTLQYPAMCSAAGVVAGVCGVGGGIIKGPLMLALGVRPEVATASSATMILATSLSATTVYAGLGAFSQVMDYALAMATVGFIATAVGQALLHVYTKRKMQGDGEEQGHQNSSVIIKIMATIMVISACTMGYAAALEVREVVKNPSLISKFGHICPPAKGDSAAAGPEFEDNIGCSNPMLLTI